MIQEETIIKKHLHISVLSLEVRICLANFAKTKKKLIFMIGHNEL